MNKEYISKKEFLKTVLITMVLPFLIIAGLTQVIKNPKVWILGSFGLFILLAIAAPLFVWYRQSRPLEKNEK